MKRRRVEKRETCRYIQNCAAFIHFLLHLSQRYLTPPTPGSPPPFSLFLSLSGSQVLS